MPGDPNECRQHALNCARLAKEASTPEARQNFLRLERSWLRLAVELEDSNALLKALNQVTFDGEAASPLTPDDAEPQPNL